MAGASCKNMSSPAISGANLARSLAIAHFSATMSMGNRILQCHHFPHGGTALLEALPCKEVTPLQ
jgi:putative component of membrane protein insertase Oxa1/YidC/SpoIIIJ protein YidD